ncbi:MAG: outer membrane PBP1 activator LpoA protein [Parasphingorhabdus sp.]|jgi:outer membrane PBP1 activator LpoA protein
MQKALTRKPLNRVGVITLSILLGGCAASSYLPIPKTKHQPSVQPVVVPQPESKVVVTTTALQDDQGATSPWHYIKLSRQASGVQHNDYLLDAIEGFLDLSQDATARTMLEGLQVETFNPVQQQRHLLLLARSHYLAGQYKRSEKILKRLAEKPGLDRGMTSNILLLRAKSQSALSNPEAALRFLVAREPFLQQHGEILHNQNTIWRVLSLIGVETLNQVHITSPLPTLSKWAELALLSQRTGWNTHLMQQQLETWQQLNPAHPASQILIPDLLANLGEVLTQYDTVAILLPLTSGFGAAAKAFFDGFSVMQTRDTNPLKPRVLVYDIGDRPELASFYYKAAIREGAQLVIGPLGKSAVDTLVQEQELHVPTMLLGNTDTIPQGKKNVFQFGLSPEEEAREVAKRAFADGHRIAAILHPEIDWGIRQVEAFTEQWLSLGGQIAESAAYSEQRSDHTQTIKLLLNVDESETRRRKLRQKLGVSLEFLARKRQDLDFIFLTARSDSGRLLKPQLNFYNASSIPVYSISQIYSGAGETVKDLDLDGIVFGDMPWMVIESGSSKFMRDNLPEANQYRGKSLDRLFALGLDTYQLLFRLEQMKNSPTLSFQGSTGRLKLRPDGVISRELEWSRFNQGKPVSVGWESALLE